MSRRRPVAALAAAAVAVVGALGAVPAPAFARPLPTPDTYATYAGGTYTVSPLDNDDVSFLSSGELSLCGIRGVDAQKIYVEQSGDSLLVEVRDGYRGSTRFTYDACQGSSRVPSTVTLNIALLADVTGVKKKNTRGKVLFTNPNSVPVRVTYGSASSGRPDATRTVAARRSITVATSRASLYWLAIHSDDGVPINVGDDTIYRLQTRSR